jgi:hypothetical protein
VKQRFKNLELKIFFYFVQPILYITALKISQWNILIKVTNKKFIQVIVFSCKLKNIRLYRSMTQNCQHQFEHFCLVDSDMSGRIFYYFLILYNLYLKFGSYILGQWITPYTENCVTLSQWTRAMWKFASLTARSVYMAKSGRQ